MRYHFFLLTHSGLAWLMLLAMSHLTSGAAISTQQPQAGTVENTSISDELASHVPDLRRRDADPSALTTTYHVDHTTIIVIDPSARSQEPPSAESNTASGSDINTELPPASIAPSEGGAVKTSTDSNSPPSPASTENPLTSPPATTTDSPAIVTSSQSDPSFQAGTTSQPESPNTSDSSTSEQDSDGSVTIVPPQSSNPTSTESTPSNSANEGTESDSTLQTHSPPGARGTNSQTFSEADITTSNSLPETSDTQTNSETSSTGQEPSGSTSTLSESPSHTLPTPDPPAPSDQPPSVIESTGDSTPSPASTEPSVIDGLTNLESTSLGIGGQIIPAPGTSISTVIVTTIFEVGSGTTTQVVPVITSLGPSTITETPRIPESMVLASVSSISSVIAGVTPMVQSWEASPTPGALKDDTLDRLGKVNGEIDDFILDLGGGLNVGGDTGGGGGSTGGCGGKKKRGIFDVATNIFDTAINAFKCIGDVVKDLTGNIDAGNIGPIPGLLNNLGDQLKGLTNNNNNNNNNNDNDNDNDNNGSDEDDSTDDEDETDSEDSEESDNGSTSTTPPTSTTGPEEPTSTSQTTSETTSTCSETTAEQVTVRCRPQYLTHDSSVTSTTTCSTSTTRTVTGCSVTPITTTVAKEATCRPRTTSACATTTAPQVIVVCRPRYQTQQGTVTTTTTCSPSTTITATGCSVTPSRTTITKEATCRPRTTTKSTSTTFVTTTKAPTSTVTSTSTTTSTSATTKTPTATVNYDILPPFPTAVPPEKSAALCFHTINEDNRYRILDAREAGIAVGGLCTEPSQLILAPDNPERVSISPDGQIRAWVRWAEDQTGCKPKTNLTEEKVCTSVFISLFTTCWSWDPDQSGTWGGGFVSNSPFGCLEFGLVNDSKQ